MKFILPLLSISLILAACSPAPQVTPPSPALGEGAGVRKTPLPTETPLPTLTPTPVAVDGIAQDADGNQLAYLNGEWTVLPKLDADYAKLMVDDEKVVAVDADGEVAFEYDMAANNWVEVVREPKRVFFARTPEMRVDMEQAMNVAQLVGLRDSRGEIPHGIYKINEKEYLSGYIVGFGDYSPSGMVESFLIRMDLANGDNILCYAQIADVQGSNNPILFVKDIVNSDYSGVMYSTNNSNQAYIKFLHQKGIGRQILFRINPAEGVDSKMKELRAAIDGKDYDAKVFESPGLFEFLSMIMFDEGVRP